MQKEKQYEWKVCQRHLNVVDPEFREAYGPAGNALPGVIYFKKAFCLVMEYGDRVEYPEILMFLSESSGVVKNVKELTTGEREKYYQRMEKILSADGGTETISEVTLKRISDIHQHMVEALRSITHKEPEDSEIKKAMKFFLKGKENGFLFTVARDIKKETETAEQEGRDEYIREYEFIKRGASLLANK